MQKAEGEDGKAGVTQRFLRRGCGRTSDERTNGILTQSRLEARRWVRLVEPVPRRAPPAKCGRECGVSAPAVLGCVARLPSLASVPRGLL